MIDFLTPSAKERFLKYLEVGADADCWEWKSVINKCGYGQFKLNGRRGRMYLSHRIAWTWQNGEIPKGLCVLHHCDNRKCCNPLHLFLGTVRDNNEDRKRKGRNGDKRGERNPKAKLKWADVREMRRQFADGVSTRTELAKQYQISLTQTCLIVDGTFWKEPYDVSAMEREEQ